MENISEEFAKACVVVIRSIEKDEQAGLMLMRSGVLPVLDFALELLGEELDKVGFFDEEPKSVNELNAFIVEYYRCLTRVAPNKLLWSCDGGFSWRWHDDIAPEFNNPNGNYCFRVAGSPAGEKVSLKKREG